MNNPTTINNLTKLKERLADSIIPGLADAADFLEKKYGDEYLQDVDMILRLCSNAFPRQDIVEWLSSAFIMFNFEALKEERVFIRNTSYRYSATDGAAIYADVYNNHEVMNEWYLPGLMGSYYLWPHHYELLRFFRQNFIKKEHSSPHVIVEFGAGHGLFSLEALCAWPQSVGRIYDISRYSLEFAQKLLTAADVSTRCECIESDILKTEPILADRIICSELIEHVAEPLKLLLTVKNSLNKNGKAYLTAAINAAQRDHIYLFKKVEEVECLTRRAGLSIIDKKTVCHPHRKNKKTQPTVFACIVTNE